MEKIFKKLSTVLLLGLVLFSCNTEEQHFEILIENGTILDGTGAEAFQGSIGINGDTIAWIGNITKRISADQTIDANTYTVTPGFIDPHTHTLRDLRSEERNHNKNYLLQGITTVINGNDGRGPIKVKQIFDELNTNGIGTNAALLVGHGSVRQLVMNMEDREPTAEDLEDMKKAVAFAMEEGALGLGAGLFYAPGSFSKTAEVIELAKVAAEYGGLYDVHMRDESSYTIGLLGSIKETIEIARGANIRANIAHIKALGVDVWGQSGEAIKLVEQARAEGLLLTADQYPYEASSTALAAALVPRWVFADIDDFTVRFDDPSLRPRIEKEMAENLRRRGGPDAVLMILATDTVFNGRTLKEIADLNQLNPVNAAIEVLKRGGSSIASFNMQEEDIQNFMKQDWVMTSSDGSSTHPRKFGAFAKKIHEYVQQKGVLSIKDMVHRSTGMTANVFGIANRGEISVGNYADINIFKPEEVKDNATYKTPRELAVGMHYVLVNGQVVVDQGVYNGKLVGRTLRRGE